jgi:rod shape-determining protein MreB
MVALFSKFPRLRRAIADPDLAIDLGTANKRLFALGKGLIADEPSLVRVDTATGSVEAIGVRAARLDASTHDERAVAPLRAGFVADVDVAVSLLTPLFRRARRLGLVRPRVLACAPAGASEEEREAVVAAARRAGAASVHLAPEPLAAAIGAGLDVSSPYAQMLVDLGDGVTDIAVVASGSIVTASSVRVACSDMHAAVRDRIAEVHDAILYANEAERLTRRVGVLEKMRDSNLTALGRDRTSGREVEVIVSGYDVSRAIDPVATTIVGAVRDTVRDLPATLSCEVIESGICLTGGGARLPGFAERIARATSLDVEPAADPLRAVINGAKQMLAIGSATGIWAH